MPRKTQRRRQPRRARKAPLYRNPVAKTLQLAHVKPKQTMVKFTQHMAYRIQRNRLSGSGALLHENEFLRIRANQVNNLLIDNVNAAGSFIAVNTAHQPGQTVQVDGWNEWKSRYNNYIVVGSKITANFRCNGAGSDGTGAFPDSTDPIQCYIAKTDDLAGYGISNKVYQINERPYVKRGLITQLKRGSNSKNVVLTSTYSPKHWFGVKDVMDNHVDLGCGTALVNGNEPGTPSPVYYVVGCQNALGDAKTSKDTMELYLMVKLEYTAVLFNATTGSVVPQSTQMFNQE